MHMWLFWVWFVGTLGLTLYAPISILLPNKWRVGWSQVIWCFLGIAVGSMPYIAMYGFGAK